MASFFCLNVWLANLVDVIDHLNFSSNDFIISFLLIKYSQMRQSLRKGTSVIWSGWFFYGNGWVHTKFNCGLYTTQRVLKRNVSLRGYFQDLKTPFSSYKLCANVRSVKTLYKNAFFTSVKVVKLENYYTSKNTVIDNRIYSAFNWITDRSTDEQRL